MGKPCRVPQEKLHKLKEWYLDGLSVNEIGRRLGLYHQHVSYLKKSLGLSRPDSVTRELTRKSKLGRLNPNWVEGRINIFALHQYIRRNLKCPDVCQHCKQRKRLDLANKSGNYKRDFDDWLWLCRKCHMTLDGRNGSRNKQNGRYMKGSFLKTELPNVEV